MDYKKHFFLGVVTTLLVSLLSLGGAQAHDPHDVVQQVQLSPNYRQDHTLYLLVRGNFLTSKDGGATWQRQMQGLNHRSPLTAFAVAPTASEHLYLATEGDGLYESTNGGRTWSPVAGLSEQTLDQVAVSPVDANGVLVTGHGGNIYRREGSEWTLALATDGPVGTMATSGPSVVVGDRQGRLYRSTDAGQTWDNLGTTYSTISSVSFSPQTDTFWIGTEGNGVLKTTDGGTTLIPVNQGLSETNVQDLVSTSANQLYASTYNQGVFYSANGGDSWEPVSQGLTKTPQADKMGYAHFSDLAISPSFDQDGTLLASGFDGLFKTTNQGQSWTQLDTLPGDIPMALALSPNYASDNTLVTVTYVGEAYISEDGGDSWQPMAKGLELPFFTDKFEPIERNDDPRRFQSLAFSPNYGQDQTLFATILNNGVLRYSPDKGWKLRRFKDWERALAIAPSPSFGQDQTVFVGTQGGRIYRSQNGGKSFKKLQDLDRQLGNESPFMVVSPSYDQDQTLFMTGAKGVYKTTDAGQTWDVVTPEEQLQERQKLKLAISPSYGEDGTLWLGTSDGLFASRNGGDTWNGVSSVLYGDHPYIEAVAVSPDYNNDQTLFVSVRGSGLLKSVDGGRTFDTVGDGTLPLAIVNNFEYGAMPLVLSPNYGQDNTLFGFGAVTGEIFKSTDGGETWATLPLPNAEIFTRYSNYQYSSISQVRFFFHIYQKPLLKMTLACTAGFMCYAMLSTVTQFIRKTKWLRRPMRMGAATVVVGFVIAILFV